MIGFAMIHAGPDAVQWKGFGLIVVCWIASPILAGILSAILYMFIKKFILRQPNSLERGYSVYPIPIGLITAISLYCSQSCGRG
jgi:phosphate/sulfate permease